MEYKLIPLLRYSSLVLLFIAISAQAGYENISPIYFGDSDVYVGQPFSITCIISVSDPIEWGKDGELLPKHNTMRHGRDENAYTEIERGVEGEDSKIAATLSVKKALPGHQGIYKCNGVHRNFHRLRVRKSEKAFSENASVLFALSPALDVQHLNTPIGMNGKGVGDSDEEEGTSKKTIFTIGTAESDTTAAIVTDIETDPDVNGDNDYTLNNNDNLESDRSEATLPAIDETYKVDNIDGNDNVNDNGNDDDNDESKNISTLNKNKDDNIGIGMAKNDNEESAIDDDDDEDEEEDDNDDEDDESYDQHNDDDDNDNDNDGDDNMNASGEKMMNPLVVTDAMANGQDVENLFAVTTDGSLLQKNDEIKAAVGNDNDNNDEDNGNGADSDNANSHNSNNNIGDANNDKDTNKKTDNNHKSSDNNKKGGAIKTIANGRNSTSMPTHRAQQPTQNPHTIAFVTPQSKVIETNMVSSKGAQIIKPQYDHEEHKLIVFEIRGPIILTCNVTESGHKLSWKKNSTDIESIDDLKDRYTLHDKENRFVISKGYETDAGNYTCSIKDRQESADFIVVAKVVVKLPENTPAVEGEKLKVQCTTYGTSPEVAWFIDNDTLSESYGRYELKDDENNVKNAILIVDNVTMEDRGNITCIGSSWAMTHLSLPGATDVTFVRVKGKYAALWPFLGIVAEVVVLCAIILIYEKRRNKTVMDESDTDQSPEQRKKKRISRNYD